MTPEPSDDPQTQAAYARMRAQSTRESDISATLAERGGRYGQFIDHATIAQGIQDVLRKAPNWDSLDVDMKQALTVIADKMARILNGDPYYEDNWHDIQGYSRLVEDRILKMREAQ